MPIYVAGTAPRMQELRAARRRRAAHPVDHDPGLRPLHAREPREGGGRGRAATPTSVDVGCTIVASIDASDRDAGREGAREIAGMYLANKVQNIQGSADVLLELAGLIRMEELAPIAEAMERGGRLAAKAAVSDSMLDRCRPIAGTPEPTASPRSRPTARPAARTSCSSSGARTASARSTCSPRGAPATSADGRGSPRSTRSGSSPSPPRRSARRAPRAREQAMAELRRATRSPRWASRSPGTRSRTAARTCSAPRGRGRRAEPDVQRPHGHLLLGPRAAAARRRRLPAAARSSRTAASAGSGSRT